MTKFAHNDVLDNGPAYIKSTCNKMVVVSAYAFGDSYASVMAAMLAEAAMTQSDFVLSSSGNNRVLTTSSIIFDSAANASGLANHIIFVDSVSSKVLWATEENTPGGHQITQGVRVDFPSLTYTSTQLS